MLATRLKFCNCSEMGCATASTSSIVGVPFFDCSVADSALVRPLRMARTLSTMTASMPSLTWRYTAVSLTNQKKRGGTVGRSSETYLNHYRVIIERAITDAHQSILLDNSHQSRAVDQGLGCGNNTKKVPAASEANGLL